MNDVPDLSKIEAGPVEMTPEWFDFRALLEEAAEATRGVIEKNGDDFRVDLSPDLGSIHADATRVRRLLPPSRWPARRSGAGSGGPDRALPSPGASVR